MTVRFLLGPRVLCTVLLALALATASLAAPRPMRPSFKAGLSPLLERLARDLDSQVEAGFGPGTDSYVPPTAHQQQKLHAVVADLTQAMGTDRESDALMRLRDDARILGLQITMVQAPLGPWLQIHERRDPARGWGMLVMRSEKRWEEKRLILEVPHPVSNPHAAEMGMRLFEAVEADAILMAGATRDCNRPPTPGVSDVTRAADSAFQAQHAALTRCQQPVVIQVHTFQADPRLPDVILSDGSGTPSPHPLLSRLHEALAKAGLRSSIGGSPEIPGNVQYRDLQAHGLLPPSGAGGFIRMEVAASLLSTARCQAMVDAMAAVLGKRSRDD